MKYFIFSFLILFGSNPLMVKGYLLAENSQCKRTIYREEYVKGIPSSPGYVKAWEEDVWLPCNQNNSFNNNSHGVVGHISDMAYDVAVGGFLHYPLSY